MSLLLYIEMCTRLLLKVRTPPSSEDSACCPSYEEVYTNFLRIMHTSVIRRLGPVPNYPKVSQIKKISLKLRVGVFVLVQVCASVPKLVDVSSIEC